MRLQTPAAAGRVDPHEAGGGEDADESARWESGVTKGGGARGGFRWFALPGEGVGVGAVEVPELLDLADELAQRGHLPHRLAAGLLAAPRLSLTLSPLLLPGRIGASARLSPPSLPFRPPR